jgi:hypothetical protein
MGLVLTAVGTWILIVYCNQQTYKNRQNKVYGLGSFLFEFFCGIILPIMTTIKVWSSY